MSRYDKLPKELQKHVQGNTADVLLNGYIRFLKEEESEKYELLGQNWSGWQKGIPFAVTAFGDLLVWTEDSYIVMCRFIENRAQVILSGASFFDDNVNDTDYQKDFFDMDLFGLAEKTLGSLQKGECYVFEPVPAMGGAKNSLYLNSTGNLWEYLNYVISVS